MIRALRFLCLMPLILCGCQGYPFAYKTETNSLVARAHVVVTQSNKTDILFVIDNSGSMQDKQDDLIRNASDFIGELAKSNADFHLGIVTTDLYASTDGGRLRNANTTLGPFYWTSPDSSDPNADAKRALLVSQFESTVASLGTQGSSNEAALGAALTALSPNDTAVKVHNAGFLRDDADLALVILSDEDDCSPLPQNLSTVATWTEDATCYEYLSYLYPVDSLVQLLAGTKGQSVGRVRVGLISGGVRQSNGNFEARGCRIDPQDQNQPSDVCGCWLYSNDPWFCSSLSQDFNQPCVSHGTCAADMCPSVPNAACDTHTCSATPARRYVSFLDTLAQQRTALGYTNGTLGDSICQTDYHQSLLNIADQVVLSNCFTLSPSAADPNAIAVTYTPAGNGNTVNVPRYDTQDPSAACSTCGGVCAQGAWQYKDSQTICLACGMSKNPGDTFDISVLTGVPN